MIFSKFKYKISPRASCDITLRILKITGAPVPDERGSWLRQIGSIGVRPSTGAH